MKYLTLATPAPKYQTSTSACGGLGLPPVRQTEFRKAFGKLLGRMGEAIRPLVEGKTVWDLGAGDLLHAERLLRLGAAQVVAVDKEPFPDIAEGRITLINSLFNAVEPPERGIDVAFLSWPDTHFLGGLVQLVAAARTVIYLGKNMDGTKCGFSVLWDHLTQREVLDHWLHHKNSMLVYGGSCGRRPLFPEEVGAVCGDVLTQEQAQRIANQTSCVTGESNPVWPELLR